MPPIGLRSSIANSAIRQRWYNKKMAEQIVGEFNHQALESSIERLAKEIQSGAMPHTMERRPEVRTGQELVKQAFLSIAPPAHQNPFPPAAPDDPLQKYTTGAPPEIRLEVEYLVDVALHKGVETALNEASKASPYVLDAVHDALVGKLYPELKRRGIVD